MPATKTLLSQFRYAVHRGRGQAYLLAQAHPTVDFSAPLIEAMRKNFAYDGQAEPSRAPYLYQLYGLSAQQARIRRAVLQGVAKEENDTWTLTQLMALALLFAQQGDAQARTSLYKRFLTRPIYGSDWVGAREIMALDGWEGLLHIARKFGQRLAQAPDDWQDDYLIRSFQENHPTLDVWAELRRVARHDAAIQRYLDNIAVTLASSAAHAAARSSKPEPDWESLLRTSSSGYLRMALRRRTLHAAELRQLAERLVREKNPALREKLLCVFTRFKFPLGYEPLLALARQKPRSSGRHTEFALEALQHLPTAEVREFALQRLRYTTRPAQYTDLLVSNYQLGDAMLLTALAKRFHNEHTIETLASSYTAIYAVNKTPECAAPLLELYQKMTCGLHRHTVVERLFENEVVPSWLQAELPFDSYADTRLLAQRIQ
jgi:hypothetical protein